jgi:hypothetical protein
MPLVVTLEDLEGNIIARRVKDSDDNDGNTVECLIK